jgi:hypothetical protein
MEVKTEKPLAYCLAIILFIAGIVCYAIPYDSPEEPVRIVFSGTAGDVLFDHKEHSFEDGYGLDCTDCHHAWDQDTEVPPSACGECHEPEGDEAFPSISEAFHSQCIGCHEDGDAGPMDCSECHAL